MPETAIPAAAGTIALREYQENDVEAVLDSIKRNGSHHRLIYQLPTGGGKTVVFAEIARRYIERFHRKILILTHRKELCDQTARTLKKNGIAAKVINAAVRDIPKLNDNWCFVAMVETLNNRLRDHKFDAGDVGLIIIDEAHNNSFVKVLEQIENAAWLGITATPYSVNASEPLKGTYNELITGEPIGRLVEEGFLAKPRLVTHEVELDSLETGSHGDYTTSSSDLLYSSPAMLDLLLKSYEHNCAGKKTLIFNNGIATSLKAEEKFREAGYDIRHLDNTTPDAERRDLLKWFKQTKNAILTSVSILTTGFDEPTVQAVILYRATTSVSLYFQMIGRASRMLPRKKTFTIIDIGNNAERFGPWVEEPDWKEVFEEPEKWSTHQKKEAGPSVTSASMKGQLRARFANTLETGFDFEGAFADAAETGMKSKEILQAAIRQHAIMCIENAASATEALELAEALKPEITYRVHKYTALIEKATKNYRDWLEGDYAERLRTMLTKYYTAKQAGDHDAEVG
jgi:superfamily II DNA or RNA helicase